nr:hypothetical protein GCM10020185_69490 [Pseudomonas brassicacearum subsp. brassicacearum]
MTAVVLLLSLIVSAVTLLGENLEALRWLTFLEFRVVGDYIQFTPLADSLAAGQWWRLVTPMLIHFGFLHIAMNGMWYWELGRRIEARQGGINLLGLTLLFSLVSNFAQYFFSAARRCSVGCRGCCTACWAIAGSTNCSHRTRPITCPVGCW